MMIAERGERKARRRPVPPSLGRQLVGVAAALLAIVGLDLFSLYVRFIPNLGLYDFLMVVAVAAWCGLWSGLAAAGLLVLHVWLVYHYRIPPYGEGTVYGPRLADHARDLRGTAFTFPFWAIVVGGIKHLLRAAATREFDAKERAAREAAERRTAEVGLRSSEAMRRLIVDAATDAVVVVGPEGVIEHWNPNAQALFGWSPEEAMGRRLDDTILPARLTGPGLRARLSKGVANPERLEAQALTREGEEIDVEISVASHTPEDGAVSILFLRDIRERKRAEEAILALNAELERRVVERTAQLEAANADLVGFNHAVSHDLRAPLRGIVTNCRLLGEDAAERLDEEDRGRLRRIEETALKMAGLVEGLLQHSRSGGTARKDQEVDLSALGATLARDLGAEAAVRVQPGMRACGDPALLGMVVANLLDNALKYVRPGEAPKVEFGQRADGAFFIRDHGIGFDMKDVDRIWKPFERLETGGNYPGTGIGLANCKRVVERHGGRMWAESALGEGTTMFFTLDAA